MHCEGNLIYIKDGQINLQLSVHDTIMQYYDLVIDAVLEQQCKVEDTIMLAKE